MDTIEKVIWIVAIISIVSLVLVFSILSADAQRPYEGDKYEYLGIRHDVRPQVCLFEPNPTHVDWKYWKDVEF